MLVDSPLPELSVPWGPVIGIIGTIAGLTAGFALNELSHLWRTRREDRRQVGRALAELLEIRHQLRAVPEAMQILRSMIPAAIPAEAEFNLRRFLRMFMPNPDALRQRYDDAVSSVAGAFPTLAFELRSKDAVTPLLTQLSAMLQQVDVETAELWVRLEDEVVHASLPILGEVIKEAAKLHGRKTRREVDSILTRKVELPESMDRFLRQLFSQALKAHAKEMAKAAKKENASSRGAPADRPGP